MLNVRTSSKFGTFGPVKATRYPELQRQHRIDHWRILEAGTTNGIGPLYGTEGELLADLGRFAEQYGIQS
jgi:hypothetical protein